MRSLAIIGETWLLQGTDLLRLCSSFNDPIDYCRYGIRTKLVPYISRIIDKILLNRIVRSIRSISSFEVLKKEKFKIRDTVPVNHDSLIKL